MDEHDLHAIPGPGDLTGRDNSARHDGRPGPEPDEAGALPTGLTSELRVLLTEPSAPPRPLDDIAGRARRHRVRRRRKLAAAATFLLVASVWGVTRLDRSDPSVELRSADGPSPAPTTAPSSTTAGPSTTAPPPDTTATAPTPAEPVLTSTIEDTDIGTGAGTSTVEYAGGSWTRCGGCGIATDDSSYYYGYEAGQSYTVRFTGVRLQVLAPDDLHGGVADVTVDGEPAATPTVDFLDDDPANREVWDSGRLDDGDHAVTFTIRAGENQVVLFDRADVYTLPEGPATTTTAPPSSGGGGSGGAGAAPGLLGAGVGDPYAMAAWLGRPVDVWETWQPHSWGELEAIPTVDGHMTNVARALADAGFGDAWVRLGWEPAFVDQVFDVLDRLKADGDLAYASY